MARLLAPKAKLAGIDVTIPFCQGIKSASPSCSLYTHARKRRVLQARGVTGNTDVVCEVSCTWEDNWEIKILPLYLSSLLCMWKLTATSIYCSQIIVVHVHAFFSKFHPASHNIGNGINLKTADCSKAVCWDVK